jgi:hypothetical protein
MPKEKDQIMRSPKFQISLRIRPARRSGLEEVARREWHTFDSLAAILLEWGYEQLKTAGNLKQLKQCGIPLGYGTRARLVARLFFEEVMSSLLPMET